MKPDSLRIKHLLDLLPSYAASSGIHLDDLLEKWRSSSGNITRPLLAGLFYVRGKEGSERPWPRQSYLADRAVQAQSCWVTSCG